MRSILIVVCMLAALLVSACGGSVKNCEVTMMDGTTYTTSSKPKFDQKSQTYTFKDLDGRAITVQKNDVKEILEHKR